MKTANIKKTGKDFYWLETYETTKRGEIRTLRRLHISKKIKRALSFATNKQIATRA